MTIYDLTNVIKLILRNNPSGPREGRDLFRTIKKGHDNSTGVFRGCL